MKRKKPMSPYERALAVSQREHEINELYEILGQLAVSGMPVGCNLYTVSWLSFARKLHKEDYRKASYVASEILARIEKCIEVDKDGNAKIDVRVFHDIALDFGVRR